MLAEFFFTPEALADDGGGNGTEVVRELEQYFFSRRSAPIALLCKLGDQWEFKAGQQIALLKNYNHKANAQAMLLKLLESCVSRPLPASPPDDESEWVRAGESSFAQVPMDRIIVSSYGPQSRGAVVSLKEFLSDRFWESYDNPRPVGRDLNSQEKVLRSVCTHAEWIILRLPYVKGGSDDEIVTAKQIIRLSNELPEGFRRAQIELQIRANNLTEGHVFENVARELSPFVRKGIEIRLTLLKHENLLNRELLAGDFAETSSGEKKRRARWYITMTHVAIGGNNSANNGEAGNAWGLLSRRRADSRYQQIAAEAPLRSERLQ